MPRNARTQTTLCRLSDVESYPVLEAEFGSEENPLTAAYGPDDLCEIPDVLIAELDRDRARLRATEDQIRSARDRYFDLREREHAEAEAEAHESSE